MAVNGHRICPKTRNDRLVRETEQYLILPLIPAMSNCPMQGAFSPWSWKVGFPSGRTPWSWATTVGVSCTAGQKVSRWTQLTSDPAVYETAWEWVTSLLLLSWLTWGLTRSEQGTYVPASWSDPTPSPDKWFSVLEKHTDWSPKGTEERWAPCNAVYPTLPQRGLPS